MGLQWPQNRHLIFRFQILLSEENKSVMSLSWLGKSDQKKKKLQIELAVFSKDLFSSWKHRRLEEGLALSTGLNSEGLLEKPQDFASHVSQLPIGAAREPPSTLASKS